MRKERNPNRQVFRFLKTASRKPPPRPEIIFIISLFSFSFQLEHPPSVKNHEKKTIRVLPNDGIDLLYGVFCLGHRLINPRHQQ
jgi:hypothetical protein